MDDPDTPSDETSIDFSRRTVLAGGAAAATGLGAGAYAFSKYNEPVLAVDLIGWMAANITIEDDDGEVSDIYIDTDNLTVEVEWENFQGDVHEIDLYFEFELTGNYDGSASGADLIASTEGKFLGEGHSGHTVFTGSDFDSDGIDGSSLLSDHDYISAADFNVRDSDRDGYYDRQRQVRATLEAHVHEDGGETHVREQEDTFVVTADDMGGVVEVGGDLGMQGEGT